MFFIIIICFLKGISVLNVYVKQNCLLERANQILKCRPEMILRCELWVVEDIAGKANHQRARVAFGIIVDCPSYQFLVSLIH